MDFENKITQEEVKQQKSIGQLAKKIDKVEKETVTLEAKIIKKKNELARLKEELKELL